MRVLVCGGRDFTDYEAVALWLGRLHPKFVIHGGAHGADSLAGTWAVRNGVDVQVFFAEWDKHGPAAGPYRNVQMLDEGKPDMVLAFRGGSGTRHMTTTARARGVPVLEIPHDRGTTIYTLG